MSLTCWLKSSLRDCDRERVVEFSDGGKSFVTWDRFKVEIFFGGESAGRGVRRIGIPGWDGLRGGQSDKF